MLVDQKLQACHRSILVAVTLVKISSSFQACRMKKFKYLWEPCTFWCVQRQGQTRNVTHGHYKQTIVSPFYRSPCSFFVQNSVSAPWVHWNLLHTLTLKLTT